MNWHLNVPRRTFLRSGILVGGAYVARVGAQEPVFSQGPVTPAEIIDLWPGNAPGLPSRPLSLTVTHDRQSTPSKPSRRVSGITIPRMAAFRAAKPNGTALLIVPGGAYSGLTIDRGALEQARWFAGQGFTTFALMYRLPNEGWAAGPDTPLADAQRAMRLIRHHALRFAIDPERIAVSGSSAGGHLAASLLTRFAARVYDRVDDADDGSARPFAVSMLCPAISMTLPEAHPGSRRHLLGARPTAEQERRYSPHLNIPDDAPPAFLVHAEDDRTVRVANTLLLDGALRARGIPAETHIFRRGGHGLGVEMPADLPASIWPMLLGAWLRDLPAA